MDFANQDFAYYERTIALMYRKFFMKRIVLSLLALLIIVIYSLIFKDHLLVNGVIVVILLGVTFLLLQKLQEFPKVYADFLAQNNPTAEIIQIEEAEYTYNVKKDKQLIVAINKKGARNLPASNKQYTLLVGFAKNFFTLQPLELYYYDMLELTYEEKFRLKRNGYSNVPRFLRRFTWSNLKATAGNGVNFILGNLFFLFILYRLLRYLWRFVQMLF
ncbi:hypothetical protein JZO76_08165 [Enterococcus sp. MJM12]|uniref:YcxB-like protein domain-containing protein n=1 Tax=Candidatus Enterococcus myersii TaxID=2815322 RepID=A0ABS3H7T5_9ENTE|nr:MULTISPECIES: hypothetical protein [Enterococcus]MBO0449512.1 hypothetical protein [Enterococcus sp. MJM12]MCD1025660.1 hypothetical protein [Enterococcus sp. SMC-9]MDT2738864.1 hypothetical protein [Enterococcus canintestini]